MRKPHKHQDPHTNALRDCSNPDCKQPFRYPGPKASAPKQKRTKDPMWEYGRKVYESDRL